MKKNMTQNKTSIINTVEKVDTTVEHVVQDTDRMMDPIRKSVFKRFPISFTLLVTFGVTATLFGFERIISEIAWLNERPLLILISGILVLVLTGTLYKKLG